eukprot:GGOE01043050.1.p1 GENE.GGOE01043050.1~~GGOE01043050.1.p1  ORF type:complete len:430 (+),score=132.58 GGOE01043050.1:89-1291(+)
MAGDEDDADFREQTKRMVDELARTDPATLKELYSASRAGPGTMTGQQSPCEMQKIMTEDPEMFQQTFREYLQRLEKGDEHTLGKPAAAPQLTPQLSPHSTPGSQGAEKAADTPASAAAPPKAPAQPPPASGHQQAPTPAAAASQTTSAPVDPPDYQEDDEVWYAPVQKQKRPESLLARWSITSIATRRKDSDDPAPPVYVNVCESEGITSLEAHSGAIPCYTSELVHHHVDVVLHPDTLAKAKFDSALREDIVNLCLHKVLFFHKLLVQQYALGGPLFSVILGEVAEHCNPAGTRSHTVTPKPAEATAAGQAIPVLVSAVQVAETEGEVEVAAALTVSTAKDVDVVLLGRNALRLQMAGALPKDIALPCDVQEDGYKCRFVRKSQTLKVTFPKCMEHSLD